MALRQKRLSRLSSRVGKLPFLAASTLKGLSSPRILDK